MDTEIAELLVGAVDLHVHPGPSPFPRRIGIFEAAQQARDSGFGAIVVKSHHHSMVSDVLAIQAALGEMPLPVFSGVALNNQVGGLNPYAVELALNQGGRIVWFPTIASAKHICVHNDELKFPRSSSAMRHSTAVSILDDEGNVTAEVRDILQLIRDGDMILAGGHLDADELNVLVTTALDMGLTRIVINHPNFVVGATVERCKEWAARGVFIEHSLCMYDDRSTFHNWPVDTLLEFIAAVGPEQTLLVSDLGQANNPLPVESYERVVRDLLDRGVEKPALRQVLTNGAKLLNL
ncbi:MAG: DUF6282 family protein [Candidatus Dormibacter sp.]